MDLYAEKIASFQVETLKPKSGNEINNSSYLNTVLGLQYSHWLPDDILMKLDKMTMANSLEGRVPFLDHKLVEFLFKTPPHLKLKGFMDKLILRDHLSKYIPGKVSKRTKKPFYMPIGRFLNEKPLKDYVDLLLSEESIKRRGYFNWEKIRSLRNSIGKEFVYDKQVFSLIALELWHRIFIDRESGWIN
jgi:asparagine synthase (glutamine-hydrolysing)